MSIESLKDKIPDFARDVRLNLSAIVNDDALGKESKYGLLLACAIATRNADVAEAFESRGGGASFTGGAGCGARGCPHHGDEQCLLQICSSGLERRLSDDAGKTPDVGDRKSRCRQGRLRALVLGGLGDQWLRRLHRRA